MTPQGNKETSFSLSSRSCIFEDDSVGNWGRKTYPAPYTPPCIWKRAASLPSVSASPPSPAMASVPGFAAAPSKRAKALPAHPAVPVGAAGSLAYSCASQGTEDEPGTCFVDRWLWERRGHAQEAVAESEAEQERHEGGMKGLVRRGGSQGPRGSAGGCRLASCSEILRVGGVPGLLQQLLPRSEPVLAPLPGRRGGKGGSTWVLLYGLADSRSVNDRFIHFIPSCPTLQVRLNQFVMVTLGSFVSLIINNGVMGQLSRKPPGPCAGTRGDLRAR